jgi:F-type H+-transporting ATPase subunit delta
MPAGTKQVKRRAKLLFRWCVVNGTLDEYRARQVIKQILQSRRRGYLAVAAEFKHMLKLERVSHTATVQSAMPLKTELQVQVRKRLETAYGEQMTTEFFENPELIGGMRIQVGCDVYDGSVQSKLAALATRFGIGKKAAA